MKKILFLHVYWVHTSSPGTGSVAAARSTSSGSAEGQGHSGSVAGKVMQDGRCVCGGGSFLRPGFFGGIVWPSLLTVWSSLFVL